VATAATLVIGACRLTVTIYMMALGLVAALLHVILDNSSTHTTPAVQQWLAQHPRLHFHFTPTGASWLNMVEAWFSILTRKSVRRGSFDTVRALIRHIERYLAEWNAHPTPFVWTKEPADIIRKALRRAR